MRECPASLALIFRGKRRPGNSRLSVIRAQIPRLVRGSSFVVNKLECGRVRRKRFACPPLRSTDFLMRVMAELARPRSPILLIHICHLVSVLCNNLTTLYCIVRPFTDTVKAKFWIIIVGVSFLYGYSEYSYSAYGYKLQIRVKVRSNVALMWRS